MRVELAHVTIVILLVSSGCIGIDNSVAADGPEMHWIDITVTYSFQHNESTHPVDGEYSHRSNYCGDAFRDGPVGKFQRDHINENINLAIISDYPDYHSHDNSLTETFENFSSTISWTTPIVRDSIPISIIDNKMTIGNLTFNVDEPYELNRTTLRSGWHEGQSTNDSVTLSETIVFTYRGILPTEAIGSYICD
jgi:hypothetical protein